MWRALLPEPLSAYTNPIYMPAWPRWIEQPDGSIEVSGRHLTPIGRRLAAALSPWATVPFMFAPFWYFYTHSRLFISLPLHILLLVFGYRDDDPDHKLFWLMWLASSVVWVKIINLGWELLLRKRTRVRFSAQRITLYFWWLPVRYPRGATPHVTFLQTEHPGLKKLPLAVQRAETRKSAALVQLYRESRLLMLQYGQNLIPLASFVDQNKANQFAVMCQQANQLSQGRSAGAFEVDGNGSREHVSVVSADVIDA